MQQRGNYRRFPGKHQRRMKNLLPKLAEWAGTANQNQQIIPDYRRWKDQRQRDCRIYYLLTPEVPVRKDVGDRKTQYDRQRCGHARNLQAEPQREPIDGHRKVNYSEGTGMARAVLNNGYEPGRDLTASCRIV